MMNQINVFIFITINNIIKKAIKMNIVMMYFKWIIITKIILVKF